MYIKVQFWTLFDIVFGLFCDFPQFACVWQCFLHHILVKILCSLHFSLHSFAFKTGFQILIVNRMPRGWLCARPLYWPICTTIITSTISQIVFQNTISNTSHFSGTIHTFTKNISVVIHKVPHHQRQRIFKNKIIMQSSEMISQLCVSTTVCS